MDSVSISSLGSVHEAVGELRRRLTKRQLAKICVQFVHFLVALGFLIVALVEFSAERPLFDVLGKHSDIPDTVYSLFQNASRGTNTLNLRRVMDLPILMMFVVYFLAILWMKCWGVWAWIMTSTMVAVVFFAIAVNNFAEDSLRWVYFSTRGTRIVLTTMLIAFGWTIVIVTLLNIRKWFPFKIKKVPPTSRLDKVVLWVWNCCALFLVLTLCLLVWFSRLYTSWACTKTIAEIHTLCQFTNQVQCYPCANAYHCTDLDECVKDHFNEVYHCLSPTYTVSESSSFCLFNYNIGPYTFISVFAYVGGLYVFTRTALNGSVKVVKLILHIAYKVFHRKVFRKTCCYRNDGEEERAAEDDGRKTKEGMSLLASLPNQYSSTNGDVI